MSNTSTASISLPDHCTWRSNHRPPHASRGLPFSRLLDLAEERVARSETSAALSEYPHGNREQEDEDVNPADDREDFQRSLIRDPIGNEIVPARNDQLLLLMNLQYSNGRLTFRKSKCSVD